ncbi:hypothetical protein [Selenomonas sp. F0473]|uniref:hypothetical protein n=1 Tax=Selenomonas sp. F0473 TaxID=999423 RepID=UPI0025D6A912|nr:hypothetical protein [Selenomonas sp. F0473]
MEPELANDGNKHAESIKNYPIAIRYLVDKGVSEKSAIQFFKSYNENLRSRDWTGGETVTEDVQTIWNTKTQTTEGPIPRIEPFRTYRTWMKSRPPEKFDGVGLQLPNSQDAIDLEKQHDSHEVKKDNHSGNKNSIEGNQSLRIFNHQATDTSGRISNEGGNKGIFGGVSNKGSVPQSVQTPNEKGRKIESQGYSSSTEEQKGTNENKTKETVDPVKETVQNMVTTVETIPYNYLGKYKGDGALSPYARTGYRWFGRIGGISGTIFLGMDFYKDYHKYSGTDLMFAWGTDLIPLGGGIAGSIVGGAAGPAGAYTLGIAGQTFAASRKEPIREWLQLKTDEEKAAEKTK